MSQNPGWQPAVGLLVAGTLFMEQMDGTILVTAAPQIAADFGVGSADLNIAMTAYLLAVACAIPLGGWLASRVGARRVFCGSIAVFTIASILCALSGDLTMLVLGRILQGIAGGMMVPVGRLVVLRGTDKSQLLRSIAIITWPALLAPVLAPVLGGLITTVATWNWIFLINVPLGVIAFVAALILVNDRTTERLLLDWVGLVLCTLAVLALMTSVELLAAGDAVPVALATAVPALGLCGGAIWWLLRTRHPLLNLRVFSVPTFRVTNSGGFIFRMVVNAVPFLLPLLFQDGFGWTPIESGLAVGALFLGNIGIKPATTPLLRRFGFRTVLLGSVAGTLLCLVLFALLSPAVPVALIAILAVVSGAFRSIGFTAYNTIQFADIEQPQLGSANTLSSTLAQMSAGLGIAVAASSLRLTDAAAAGALSPYRAAFLVLAALSIISAVSVLRLSKDAAGHVTAR